MSERQGWFHRAWRHPVTRSAGTAVRHTSWLAHRILLVGVGAVVIVSAIAIAAAWRLSHGPLDSLWLANRVMAAMNDTVAPVHVSFGAVSMQWEGYHRGVDYPLDLRILGLEVADESGRKLLTAQDAQMGFSFTDLLLGHTFPRSVDIDGAHLELTRETAKLTESPDSGGQSKPVSPRTLPNQLRHLRFRNASVAFHDPSLGLDVLGQGITADLQRLRNGHLKGEARAPITVGAATASLSTDLDIAPGQGIMATVTLTPFRPAATGVPALQSVDVPVGLTASLVFDPELAVRQAQVAAQLGAGQVHVGKGSAPLLGGSVRLSAAPDQIQITEAHLQLAKAADGGIETADLTGSIKRASGRLSGELRVGADHIDAADLSTLWPEGTGGGARGWVTQHVIGGLARGTAEFAVEADENLRDLVLTRAHGDLDVANGAFTWIDHVPPIEQAEVHLHLLDPDTLDIVVPTGRQRVGGKLADLRVSDGRMRITGLSAPDQSADIRVNVDGPIVSTMALLSEPRLRLLSAHPIGLKPTGGDAAHQVHFRFPLMDKLQMDDVEVNVTAKLTQVRIPDAVGRNALDGGAFDLTVDKDGLQFKGQASLSSIPVSMNGAMDFRAGPSDQVLETINVAGQADAAQLSAVGLPVGDILSGSIPMTAVVTERRDGAGAVTIGADLTAASAVLSPIGWRKPAGTAAMLSAIMRLAHDKLTAIDRIALRGDGVSVSGNAAFPDGGQRSVTFDTIRLGRTDARATIQIAQDSSVRVALQGGTIDLSSKLTETGSSGDAPPQAQPVWALDGRFGKAILANNETASDLLVKATGGGEKVRTLDALGSIEGSRFSIRIDPEGGKRRLSVRASDAGRFLRGLDAVKTLMGGRLVVDGMFDGNEGLSPLAGTARVDQVVVRNSPLLGKLLQGITLYGLVDALRGPGMNFSQVRVPYRYDGRSLYLDNAVAENSSLGLTATGEIGLASRPSSLNGTIVPAYFFNSLPGQLPLVGKLFSPEKGGGLFAARFTVEGPISDPSISVNPISALTPGFLRGLFGVFNRGAEASAR